MATKKTTTEDKKVTVPSILLGARITEKAANNAQFNVYMFNVAVGVTKSEIAKAFKAQYKQTPVKVNTINTLPKRRVRGGRVGFSGFGKKAYVFLLKGATIDII
jgi:ribosomal protein L23